MIDCFLTPTGRLGDRERLWIAERLCRDGSVFQASLRAGKAGGIIALLYDHGEIVGWARTERWGLNDTLEAFVDPKYRRRGLAAYAASGLAASYLGESGLAVAVFRPSMLLVARAAGLHPTLFDRKDGTWVESWET